VTKKSGLGGQLYIDGYNVSNDVGSLNTIGCPSETLDVTGLDKSGFERIYGRRDGIIEFAPFFNPATGAVHDQLSTLPLTDRIVTCCPVTPAVGGPAAGIVAKQIGYDATRGDDGAFTFAVPVHANGYGLEWGDLLTPGVATFGGAFPGASIDYGASVGTTNFGLQAYLHVFVFTGTSATIAIQSSTDDGAGDAFANVTGGVFTTVTGVTAERIQTGRTAAVERYVRINVTGTFSLMWFNVFVVKNLAATAF
jgi:hypothetical protein